MALRIPAKVAKEVRKSGMPPEDWASLKARLERIARDPCASHPDVERVGDGFQVRHGVWRAIYGVKANGDVVVVRVRHRREAYRQ